MVQTRERRSGFLVPAQTPKQCADYCFYAAQLGSLLLLGGASALSLSFFPAIASRMEKGLDPSFSELQQPDHLECN